MSTRKASETREEYLERLLAELIDELVGSSYLSLRRYALDEDAIKAYGEIHQAYFDIDLTARGKR